MNNIAELEKALIELTKQVKIIASKVADLNDDIGDIEERLLYIEDTLHDRPFSSFDSDLDS